MEKPIQQIVEAPMTTTESICRGFAQAQQGIGRSVDDVFDDLERDES